MSHLRIVQIFRHQNLFGLDTVRLMRIQEKTGSKELIKLDFWFLTSGHPQDVVGSLVI